MALIQVNYLSKSLFRTVPVQVILPVDKISFENNDYVARSGSKFKTLYLLHGLLGNYTDWVSGTRIQRWAEDMNLAVVMPSGDNAFYIDSGLPNNNYGEFIGSELVNITRVMFPLSDKREDTFIAGLSMGGYGAIRNGLKYHETFSHIAALSAAIHMFEENTEEIAGELKLFGDMSEARKSDMNPAVLLESLSKAGESIPKFYLSCGTEDSLLTANRNFRDLLEKYNVDITYTEAPGGHEWDFWDSQIKKVLDWLPLDESDSGLGSGNVNSLC